MSAGSHTDQKWWDDFWARQDLPAPSDKGDTWYDVVWQYALERCYELFQAAPGRKMLECGCGSARVSQYMAQRGYDLTLIDYSGRALALARSRFESMSLPGRFVRGDMMDLCLPDGEFDVVYSGGVLEFFADIQRPIDEMTRVLKPRGLFAAQMVPAKFSIQTIADVERSVVYSARNVLHGKVRDALRLTKMVDAASGVQPWPLSEYVRAGEKAGLTAINARVTAPFPALALPRAVGRQYARAMKALIPQWRTFDDSTARWTELWGIAYTIYGRKTDKGAAGENRR